MYISDFGSQIVIPENVVGSQGFSTSKRWLERLRSRTKQITRDLGFKVLQGSPDVIYY